MYNITEENNRYCCCLSVQDGQEFWYESSLQKAIETMIFQARLLNNNYIVKADIAIHYLPDTPECRTPEHKVPSVEELEWLEAIRLGTKVVLSAQDPRIRYKISHEDCELIVAIREGRVITLEDGS